MSAPSTALWYVFFCVCCFEPPRSQSYFTVFLRCPDIDVGRSAPSSVKVDPKPDGVVIGRGSAARRGTVDDFFPKENAGEEGREI